MFFLLINSIKPTGFLESQQQVVNDVWNEKFLSSAQSEYIQFHAITAVLGYLF